MGRIGKELESLVVATIRDPSVRLILAAAFGGFIDGGARLLFGDDAVGPILPVGVGALQIVAIALALKAGLRRLFR